jgi:hypothetical protein
VGASALVIDVEPYERCRVAGLVQQLRLDPRQRRIEATVSDGTGVIIARWPIRRPTPELGAAPGRAVILEGVPVIGGDGELALSDPTVEIADFPQVA